MGRPPQRDDSRRNRANVLRAAVESLTTGEPDDLHAGIARRTGLGRSTVYRHAGDRQDVADSVVADQLGVLQAAAREVDAGRATIRDLLDLMFSTAAQMHPLVRLVLELPAREQHRYLATIVRTVTPAFEQARADGRLRADATPEDLLPVFAMLVGAGERARAPEQMHLMVRILLDGLLLEPGPEASG